MKSLITKSFLLALFYHQVLLTISQEGPKLITIENDNEVDEDENNVNKYEPTWDSLDSRPLPQWYDEAKIGKKIFDRTKEFLRLNLFKAFFFTLVCTPQFHSALSGFGTTGKLTITRLT